MLQARRRCELFNPTSTKPKPTPDSKEQQSSEESESGQTVSEQTAGGQPASATPDSESPAKTPRSYRRIALRAGLIVTLLLAVVGVFELELALAIHRVGFYGLRRELIQHYYKRGERGETFLIAAQTDPSSELRSRAIHHLARRMSKLPCERRQRVHQALVETLDHDPGPVVRGRALLGLAAVGAPELAPRLAALIEDPWLGVLALEQTARYPGLNAEGPTPELEAAIRRSLVSPDPGRREAARLAFEALLGS